MYKKGLKNVVSISNKFNDDKKLAICREKHQFKKCHSLLDIEYLKKHFIAYYLLWNRTQKQMKLAVNQIKAATVAATDDDTNGDTGIDDSDTTTDNDQDFQEGGE